jgi:hypothetical protein
MFYLYFVHVLAPGISEGSGRVFSLPYGWSGGIIYRRINMVFQLVIGILTTILGFAIFFIARHLRKSM